MSNPITTDDQVNALAVIQEQVTALTDPGPAVESIAAGLDELYATGANAGAISAIQTGAEALLQTTQQLDQALKTTMETARQLIIQRRDAQTALTDLKKALKEQNSDVPEIKKLWESGVVAGEELAFDGFDVWEEVHWSIEMNTGLKCDEVSRLTELLSGDVVVNETHPLWNMLRAWIGIAQNESSSTWDMLRAWSDAAEDEDDPLWDALREWLGQTEDRYA